MDGKELLIILDLQLKLLMLLIGSWFIERHSINGISRGVEWYDDSGIRMWKEEVVA
jgi:hypothetical protein